MGKRGTLHVLGESKSPLNLPSLRKIIEAGSISLVEVLSKEFETSALRSAATDEKGKRRDWLPLLLREALGAQNPCNMHFKES